VNRDTKQRRKQGEGEVKHLFFYHDEDPQIRLLVGHMTSWFCLLIVFIDVAQNLTASCLSPGIG